MNLIFFFLQKFSPFSIFRIPGVENRRVTNDIPIFSVSYTNPSLNYCTMYRNTNLLDTEHTVEFSNVFSSDVNILRDMIKKIGTLWNVTNAHSSMYI